MSPGPIEKAPKVSYQLSTEHRRDAGYDTVAIRLSHSHLLLAAVVGLFGVVMIAPVGPEECSS
jgi:hypothetical protein